jgi:tetratricopeptide (TPR) repeat protein
VTRLSHLAAVILCVSLAAAPVRAEDTPAQTVSASTATPTDPSVKSAAVALNYCRAAFHRIRQMPTRTVLYQEQEKILNNLNLTAISEPEVIALYTSVLDEINQIGVADHERRILKQSYRSAVRRNFTWNAIAFSTDLATAQFGSAVKTGASSWWDYRTTTNTHESDILKVDKQRLNSVMTKSSQFLDTFWKLAQKKQIPDRWLIRGDDLDALDKAVREPDPQVRLRVLRRMAPFMEAYPPYWYYLGRTQQELGNLDDAMSVYDQLVQLGDRHFRKDDMLATGLANKAAIQEYLGQTDAAITASKALNYSTDVWEANLVCARVLQRHRQFADAEDAVLRNLDVGLETDQSRTFLVSVYYYAEDRVKLARTLNDPQFAGLPTPVLIRCAALLGPDVTPPHVLQAVASSINAQPRVSFGPDEVVLHASDAWQLPLAKMTARLNGKELTPAHVVSMNGGHELHLKSKADFGSPIAGSNSKLNLDIDLSYPDTTAISLKMNLDDDSSRQSSSRMTAFRGPATPTLRLSSVDVGDKRVSLAGVRSADLERSVPVPTSTESAGTLVPALMPIESDPASD